MSRVIICLLLTLACAFGSYESFMSNDYGPIKQWITYYKEYKEIQAALDKGTESKEELLARLEKMYPQHAAEIEAQFKKKYGDLKASADDAKSSFHERWNSYTDQHLKESLSQAQKRARQEQTDSEDNDVQDSTAQRPSRTADPSSSARARHSQHDQQDDEPTGHHQHDPNRTETVDDNE